MEDWRLYCEANISLRLQNAYYGRQVQTDSWRPHCHGAIHESRLERKGLDKMQWDLREAALAAVILASGVWMIIGGLTNLWGE